MKTARMMANKQADSGATTGYEANLWAMADTLRGSMDAAEYKHVVLGLIFLKYISDAFEERHAAVLAEWGEEAAEDRDEYIAENIFWVPQEARWAHLKARARQPTVGQTVDRAMTAIERDNPVLKEVLPKLNQKNLKAIPLVVPANSTSRARSRLIAPLFAMVRHNTDQSRVLAALRDDLLSKLMSGETQLAMSALAIEAEA